jgi:hypothetical protein
MAKLGIFAALSAIVLAIGFATVSSADTPEPCKRKDFKTELVRDACKTSQAAAKDAMKKFMKDAKIKSCNACHSKLAPTYELKTDALDQYKKAGGKVIEDAK